MIKEFGVVHVIAECEDCDWRTEKYKNGQAIAARHAKHYCHKVRVEVGLDGFYNGRKSMNKKLQTIIVLFAALGLAGFFGCSAMMDAVTPAFIEPEVAAYTDVNDASLFLPYTSLWDAKRIDACMDHAHQLKQTELIRLIEDDNIRYSFLKDNSLIHIAAAEQLKRVFFSPEGPAGLLIPTLLGGTIAALTIPRPGDKKKIKELEMEVVKNGSRKT